MPTPSLAKHDYLAYFKYKGELVKDGYLDARKASTAMQGIDEVMRYFLIQVNGWLLEINFEIPIAIRTGSWEAIIPNSVNDRLIRAISIGSGSYGVRLANQLAENEFKEVKSKNIVKEAIKGIKWVLKIARHMESLGVRKFKDVQFEETEQQELVVVGLENKSGEILYVPQEYIEVYRKCPEHLFDKLMKNVEAQCEFELGFNPNEPTDKDDTGGGVTITVKDKHIFTLEEKEEIILFPELKHGDYVVLEGHVSRGNENTNTIGFEYKGHILTCSPTKRMIKDYKVLLFTNCRIKGNIDRSNQYSLGNEKRPHIRFTSLVGLPQPGTQTTLF
jgi:hypothetical protein